MRKPKLEQPPGLEHKETGFVTQVREYQLITPLFGGGVVPGEADPVTTVRGTEVRGHLRFWWRATQGGRFNGDLKAMKTAEDELWGTASFVRKNQPEAKTPQSVQIFIFENQSGKPDQPFVVSQGKVRPNKKSVVPPYAAFALQPSNEEAKKGAQSGSVRVGVTFSLEISFPDEKRNEVQAALWAWETFGGIGARTRRGFGALQCLNIWEDDVLQPLSLPASPNRAVVAQWLDEQVRQHVPQETWPEHVPHISSTMSKRIIVGSGDAVDLWGDLINALRRFRQSREGNSYGPSHWPESNAIRNVTISRTSSKSPFLGNKTPRAFFGLPIIFHFPQKGEPEDTTLRGTSSERMASALILRPLACHQGQAVGLAVVLQGPKLPPDSLVLLEKDGKKTHPADPVLNSAEARKIKPLRGKTDILEAFLDTL